MEAGGKVLVSAAVLAVAACGGESSKLEISSTPTTLAQGEHPVSFRVAEAKGQLALGNVAYALEGFRKAWREDPNSVEALAGMADCYDRMGRFDLSRRNYEAALALSPTNLTLLGALASSLDQQGDGEGAGRVRQEIALRTAAAKVQAAVTAKPTETAEMELVRLVAPTAEAISVRPVTPVPPVLPAAPVAVAVTNTLAALKSVQVVSPVAVAVPVLAVAEAVLAPPTASTVTVKLPRIRSTSSINATPVEFPVKAATLETETLPAAGPHLERLSMGEIALISAPVPTWRPTTVAQTKRSTTVRFVPLREASTVPVQVRLLNAARINRLAARTQSWLVARGWRGLGVGNSDTIRAQSVILYPAGKRALAQRLSSQFGFGMKERASGSQITVLLGRDAARHPAIRQVRG